MAGHAHIKTGSLKDVKAIAGHVHDRKRKALALSGASSFGVNLGVFGGGATPHLEFHGGKASVVSFRRRIAPLLWQAAIRDVLDGIGRDCLTRTTATTKPG